MKKRSILTVSALLIGFLAPMGSVAHASSKSGAFIGGMITGKVLHNMSERTRAEQAQAYNNQRVVEVQQAPAQQQAPAAPSAQQKLDELDKLAAGGFITKEEYQTRRKAILDSL